jgi:drug/metabolite transporter (DMT)-like permease
MSTRAATVSLPAPTTAAWAEMGLLASIWGTSFLFIKVGLEGLSPAQIALGRLLFGAAVLLAVLAVRRERLPRARRTWLHLAVLGVISNIAPFYLFGFGEERISSGLAGIYNASVPLATMLVALAAFDEEHASPARLGGLALGFGGVLVVLAPWQGVGGSDLAGQLACLGAAACYGVSANYARHFTARLGHSPLVLAGGQLLAASVLLGAATPFVADDTTHLDLHIVLAIASLGALGTGVAYLIYFRLIVGFGAVYASTVTYLVPVVAVALGVAFRGESLHWYDVAGALLVLAGVALSQGLPRRFRAILSRC